MALGGRASSRTGARVATPVIRLLCRRDIRFLLCFSSDSSILTWEIATIGACRTWGGGASTWGCYAGDVERGVLRGVTSVGLGQRLSSSARSSSSNNPGKRDGR